jgi:hypothetical protein
LFVVISSPQRYFRISASGKQPQRSKTCHCFASDFAANHESKTIVPVSMAFGREQIARRTANRVSSPCTRRPLARQMSVGNFNGDDRSAGFFCVLRQITTQNPG